MYDSWLRAPEFWQIIFPILKDKNAVHCKSVTVDDFCGISISPVISKIFEHCIGTVITLRPVIISSALSKEVAMHINQSINGGDGCRFFMLL